MLETRVQFCGKAEQWILWRNGEVHAWSTHLLPELAEILETAKNQQTVSKTVELVAHDGNQYYYVRFKDGTSAGKLCSNLAEYLDCFEEIDVLALGPQGGWIVAGDKGTFWSSIPKDAKISLRASKDPGTTLVCAALGAGGNFYLKYDDESADWGGHLHEELSLVLGDSRLVTAVAFSSSDPDVYFVSHANGSKSGDLGGNALSNVLDPRVIYMDPRDILFSSDSISSRFANDACIYRAARDVHQGVLHPDDFPAMEVVEMNNKIYTSGNRRLWVFKMSSAMEVPVRKIPLTEEFRTNIEKVKPGVAATVPTVTNVTGIKVRPSKRTREDGDTPRGTRGIISSADSAENTPAGCKESTAAGNTATPDFEKRFSGTPVTVSGDNSDTHSVGTASPQPKIQKPRRFALRTLDPKLAARVIGNANLSTSEGGLQTKEPMHPYCRKMGSRILEVLRGIAEDTTLDDAPRKNAKRLSQRVLSDRVENEN